MAKDVSLLQNIQTSPGACKASYSVGTGRSFCGYKSANTCEVNQSLPSTAMIKIEWSYQCTSTPPMHFHGVKGRTVDLYSDQGNCYVSY